MRLKYFTIFVIAVVLITGCYETKQDNQGRTIKVNKLTGDVSVIDGNKIVKLKDEGTIKAEQEASKKLGEVKDWPSASLPIAGGTNAFLQTKWSEGHLYYKFYIDKNLRNKRAYYARFVLQLSDGAGFLIEEIQIPVSSITGSVGEDGKTIESMNYKAKAPMTEDTYKKIAKWNILWSGFEQ
ncbi:MAG: hypothetical protein CSYNP_01280 [Syntrophus sp. SKADARSKE-3]|nr:hypothetical protein [Syntrophus sp. SKADARSKE-3]